ncbi:uncharacterized protein V1510DRAFT_404507 [Dipodascopsis tothii]|uniref:uncharacterized protein n=1 Tax=Dipodascopsis tothii TaxID=44089 RepID=UPI0034CDE5BF
MQRCTIGTLVLVAAIFALARRRREAGGQAGGGEYAAARAAAGADSWDGSAEADEAEPAGSVDRELAGLAPAAESGRRGRAGLLERLLGARGVRAYRSLVRPEPVSALARASLVVRALPFTRRREPALTGDGRRGKRRVEVEAKAALDLHRLEDETEDYYGAYGLNNKTALGRSASTYSEKVYRDLFAQIDTAGGGSRLMPPGTRRASVAYAAEAGRSVEDLQVQAVAGACG